MEDKPVTAGTIRAAITQFHNAKVVNNWKELRGAFYNRHPGFTLAADRLKEAHIRVDQRGVLLFEPAFVLNLLRKIEVMDQRIQELEQGVEYEVVEESTPTPNPEENIETLD